MRVCVCYRGGASVLVLASASASEERVSVWDGDPRAVGSVGSVGAAAAARSGGGGGMKGCEGEVCVGGEMRGRGEGSGW